MLPTLVASIRLAQGRSDGTGRPRLHLSLGRLLQEHGSDTEGRRRAAGNLRLRTDDRVCVAAGSRHPDFSPRDVGTVLLMLPRSSRGVPLYYVRRDRDGRLGTAYEDELKPLC